MLSGVLFDFDGTLVDTTDLVVKCFQHTLEPYLERKVEPEEIYPYCGMTLREGLAAFGKGDLEELVATYRRYSNQWFDELVCLFPGIREGLEQLHAEGIKLGIVTSRVRETTMYGLRLFDLEDYFPVIVAGDEVKNSKPKPEPVLKGLELLGLPPAEVVMVGDSPNDVLAARGAGVTSIVVGWSRVSPDCLLHTQPDAVVNSMEELVAFCLEGGVTPGNRG